MSKLFMVLFVHLGLIKSKEKLLVESMFSCITFILAWFWYFSIAFLTVTKSLSEECWLDHLSPGFERYFQNICWKFLLINFNLKQLLLFSAKVILSSFKVLFVNEGYTIIQNSLFRLYILHWVYSKILFWSFLTVLHKISVSYMLQI